MNKNPLIKRIYAEKYATSANYYKNAVGMNFWVDKLHIIPKKEAFEKEWMNWALQDETKKSNYATTFQDLKRALDANAGFKRAQTYYTESFSTACEVIQFLGAFGKSFTSFSNDVKTRTAHYRDFLNDINHYYRGLNIDVDKRVTKGVLKLLKDSLPEEFLPEIFATKKLYTAEAINQYVDGVFKTSVFCDSTKLQNWLKNPSGSIESDAAMELAESILKKESEIFKTTFSNSDKVRRIVYSYYNSVADFKASRYYPDADRTVRLSYGTVTDLQLEGRTIPFQTTLSSLIGKADSVNKDYQLNPKLLALWQNKDYGRYAGNGDMPVCFITNGDVTGGNSGSPMMNADGKIIGLVFDCNWESMTREFNYENNLHKVICVDVRYILLITEKFSGTDRIISEIEKANQG
jgi:hypothetical protein